MGVDGKKLSCAKGVADGEGYEERRKKAEGVLVRVGSGVYSKSTKVTKGLNIGFEMGKTPSGVMLRSLNEASSGGERRLERVNKKSPVTPTSIGSVSATSRDGLAPESE